MSVLQRFVSSYKGAVAGFKGLLPGESPASSSEIGNRPTPENQLEYAMRLLTPSFSLRQVILDIRAMDKADPRVKKIHERTSRAACKDGLKLKIAPTEKRIAGLWDEFVRGVELNRREKLESDMRGALMEGNLPLQWVLDTEAKSVVRGVRMPTDTLRPLVGPNGQFLNPMAAYEQWDWIAGKRIAVFPLWQLNMVRVRPDNYDDWGSFGRPYLDASREVWKQLRMTERDLVIRRHTRAPQRLAHVLEGAGTIELEAYQKRVENDQNSVTTDFFLNKKGSVTSISGDGNLDQIADVAHLLDTFMAGAPAPKGLFGYIGDLARDILEDLKRDFYDELDALQDTVSFVYECGFRLRLLLAGINPDSVEMCVQFAQRRTDTPNQRADLALKYQALYVPPEMCWDAAGLDPREVQKYLDERQNRLDPYPQPGAIAQPGQPGAAPAKPNGAAGAPKVTVVQGNRRKGESDTTVSH